MTEVAVTVVDVVAAVVVESVVRILLESLLLPKGKQQFA